MHPTVDPEAVRVRWMAWGGLAVLAVATAALTALVSSRQPVTLEADLHPREAGQRGLDYLLSHAQHWTEGNRCFGCHVQAFALAGAGIGKKNGYRVDEEVAQYLADFVIAECDGGVMQTDHTSRHSHSTALTVFGLSQWAPYAGPRAKRQLQRSLDYLMSVQASDGRWLMDRDTVEPPIDQGDAADTAYVLLAMRPAATGLARLGIRRRARHVLRAVRWLREAPLVTTQDKAMAAAGLAAAGVSARDRRLREIIRQLEEQQNEDGGWGERKGMGSNAYATGQVLYALRVAGEGVGESYFRRGVVWLLEHQLDDGSWKLAPSQSVRPSRFAATMWAVVGIGETFDIQTEREFLLHMQRR